MDVKQIAQVCHEANRAYCETIGDRSQLAWDEAPGWQRKSAVAGVEFHLKTLEAGREPQPSASHESWLAEKKADGWKFGPVKDPLSKEHPCFVPYEQLPAEQKLKDFIFCAVVKGFYSAATVPV
jgi:hypothetical protein